MHKLGRLLRSLRKQLCEANEPSTSLTDKLRLAVEKGLDNEDLRYNTDYEVDVAGQGNNIEIEAEFSNPTGFVAVNDSVSDVIYDLKQAHSRADVDRMLADIDLSALSSKIWLPAGSWGDERNPDYASVQVNPLVRSLGYKSYDDENDEDGWSYEVDVVFDKNMRPLDYDYQSAREPRWLSREPWLRR